MVELPPIIDQERAGLNRRLFAHEDAIVKSLIPILVGVDEGVQEVLGPRQTLGERAHFYFQYAHFIRGVLEGTMLRVIDDDFRKIFGKSIDEINADLRGNFAIFATSLREVATSYAREAATRDFGINVVSRVDEGDVKSVVSASVACMPCVVQSQRDQNNFRTGFTRYIMAEYLLGPFEGQYEATRRQTNDLYLEVLQDFGHLNKDHSDQLARIVAARNYWNRIG